LRADRLYAKNHGIPFSVLKEERKRDIKVFGGIRSALARESSFSKTRKKSESRARLIAPKKQRCPRGVFKVKGTAEKWGAHGMVCVYVQENETGKPQQKRGKLRQKRKKKKRAETHS
jgi:hypothetical protein